MILEAEHISKAFGGRQVLSDVTLAVDAGEAVALLGANGAGKTTLLRIVTGLLRPDDGTVLFCGHALTHNDMCHVGYLPEERGLYRQMRAGEQAVYLLRLKGLSHREAEEAARRWFDRLGMNQWWKRPVGRLSKGMQQRLQFVVSVAHNPKLLILDEPFSGFDEANTEMLKREVSALKSSGTAIVISTHNRQAAGELCDREVRLINEK